MSRASRTDRAQHARKRRPRPLALVLTLLVAMAVLPALEAATSSPAAAAEDAPWYMKGIDRRGDNECRALGEVCFMLYNSADDTTLHEGQWDKKQY